MRYISWREGDDDTYAVVDTFTDVVLERFHHADEPSVALNHAERRAREMNQFERLLRDNRGQGL